ncbi:hypothetical protein [Phenylobacterium sp.]|uniref:hypothetical protein n=1 Tax=Phenylobacterium sp. TaxID=1871053 RepID=UPI00286A153B|nr:hypothetical protein [Phenylobacterium sp.]
MLRSDRIEGARTQMGAVNENEYYQRRAEQARALAESAALPDVQAIHRDMADRYAELAEDRGKSERQTLKLAF